jgi:tRNA (guanine-N7-)-methyltransferase
VYTVVCYELPQTIIMGHQHDHQDNKPAEKNKPWLRRGRRHGKAPRQLNPLKPQYCNLMELWRDKDGPEPETWVCENFSDLNLPFVLDVGCGEGEWALQTAQHCSDLNILGLELRSAALTPERRAQAKELPNLALLDANVLSGDLKIIIKDILKVDGLVATVMVQFPDPHWKTKHRKRRILSQPLLQTCFECLSETSTLFVRTDVKVVAEDVSILARKLFCPVERDPLLDRLCEIPTERMEYVQRRKSKGGSIFEKTFRIRTDGGASNSSSEDEDDGLQMEPFFGFYDY